MAAAQFDSATLRDFPSGARYLVGVSGGRDSIALVHLLLEHGYRRLVVCHLNHQLRGRAATADAKFVERVAEELGLDREIGSANVRKLAATRQQSIETAARDARYSFFAAVARRRRCCTIFLGHHADDVVETFLLNLFRGAGTTGLASMRAVSTRRIDGVQLTVVRPFHSIWREQIDDYVRRNRLRFREDETNKRLEPLRNRVRHQLIPNLEKTFGRDVRRNVWRAAAIAAEEDTTLATLVPTQLAAVGALALKPLRDMSVALQRRTLRDWLRTSHIPDVGFDLIERIRQLLEPSARAAKTNLPRDRHVRRRAGKLFIE